ncbi:MAG: hypothetical protein QME96_16140, partial [Myxococcota bacterium]|nr:hypothetical protein [Myxococcota bacterium]
RNARSCQPISSVATRGPLWQHSGPLKKFDYLAVFWGVFSGRISREELEHDRDRWYARLVAEGKLDSLRVRDNLEQVKKMAHPIGYIAFGIGVALIILICWAMSSRLLSG